MKNKKYLLEERNRTIKLTNIIALSLFSLCLLVSILFKVSTVKGIFPDIMLISSPIFLLPYVLNRAGFYNVSRLLISLSLPIWLMAISLYSKQSAMDQNIINPVNYFDVRIGLINSIVIPFVLFSFKEKRLLFSALIAPLTSLIFFDPLHNLFNVGYYDSGMIGNDYYFSTNLVTTITIIFLSIVLLFLKNQVLKSDMRQSDENSNIKRYLSELVKLSNSSNINNGLVEESKKEILHTVKNCLNVSRISVWTFNHDKESISCEYLLNRNELTTPDTELFARDFPSYFLELKRQQLSIAHDARTHEATSEFAETYLKPLSIYSMMDAPFLDKGKLGGVICCEHQNEFKQWGAAESLLLKALGDFLSYAIIVNDRMQQNQLLTEKNTEITRINENLESIVKKRTKELEAKNKQLTEYAYINSHILRAPVARISGLYNLFRMQFMSKIDDPSICDYMGGAIDELEAVTLEINKAIEESGTVDRVKLKK